MRKLFLFMSGILVLTAMSSAPVNAEAAAAADTLASGTVLSVELSTGLDAKKCKANDKIAARAVIDLLLHGEIVVPRNTEIIGHVTEAKAHSKSSAGSMVGIVFDYLLLKGGREVSLQMTVQAIARPLPPSAYESGPNSPADMSTMPGQVPRGGSLIPGRVPPSPSSGATTKYPNNIASGSSSNPPGRINPPANSLDSTSRGVFGINGLSLDTSGPVSVLSSSTGNVHLDRGTQLTLRVQ
jgi:hypothetical protein